VCEGDQLSIIARRPDQNAYIEQFNRSYPTAVLNAHLFESIAELPALSLLGNTPDGREADTRSRGNEADRRHNEGSGPGVRQAGVSPSYPT
jgi:transposase InsO family protein